MNAPDDPLSALRDEDSYGLASLAAQMMPRQHDAYGAVDAAWSLLDAAKNQIEEQVLLSPKMLAEYEAEAHKRQAERLDNLRLKYEDGVYAITRAEKGRWSGKYGALSWFKQFLQWKAQNAENTADGVEARVEAWLSKYRNGFTGEQALKLRAEYDHWRNKGKQGRVKKKRDGRLRANRQRKEASQQQERNDEAAKGWQQLTGDKVRFEAMDESQAKLATGSKTAVRGGGTLISNKDAPNP